MDTENNINFNLGDIEEYIKKYMIDHQEDLYHYYDRYYDPYSSNAFISDFNTSLDRNERIHNLVKEVLNDVGIAADVMTKNINKDSCLVTILPFNMVSFCIGVDLKNTDKDIENQILAYIVNDL